MPSIWEKPPVIAWPMAPRDFEKGARGLVAADTAQRGERGGRNGGRDPTGEREGAAGILEIPEREILDVLETPDTGN